VAVSAISRAVLSIALALAVMALGAYALGRLTSSDWVWWLAPLTVALEGARLIRPDFRDRTGIASSADPLDADPDPSAYVTSCVMTTGMAVWGVCASNRWAILTGTAVAVVWNAFDWDEHPVLESPRRAA
jgi:hypothetical protein